ncbi:Tubulin-specific chaperone D [Cyphellophora attinorum]|uniref:Tubulin-specific chaperone D n=1 Tax=Cyphellophora attinorum TaxID=1664694 RepID=A0A0N1H6X6_9EURO|nr:Tubulin-specific chaperone D [Phialophora attinorum]KPI38582.1 Tubulin-specific chaperone D [Phialophora attinorum]
MDAAEVDYDAKLYKASGDIIPELQVKLPLLIWHDGNKSRLRTHVLYTKCAELRNLIDRFQEWPQLLDPVLASLVQSVVDGFQQYITQYADYYGYETRSDSQAIPLPLGLSQILYTLCKVRGYKVIVRLLNNEPRYVEPMLFCMRHWQTLRSRSLTSPSVWEEKYIMLLWLSHLMLAPFELSTLSTHNKVNIDSGLSRLTEGLPEVAVDVLSLGFEHITSPSKERESAVILLVRLALRKDMQSANLSEQLVDYAVGKLLDPPSKKNTSVYHAIGYLSLLYALMNLGTMSEVAPFLTKVYRASATLFSSSDEHHATIRGSAPARKLLIKVQRVCLTHALALARTPTPLDGDMVNEMLEEGIQTYLDALGDQDSPVRMAASKALSVITLNLDESMAAEIVEAVLGSLAENILVEDPNTGRSMAKTDLPTDNTLQMKRNISLVDPQKWQGLMLTLGHLLFRRSPPPHQLVDIIEALLVGLEFEQRSSVGTSVGNGVRDAACFGIWALSRKYSTLELDAIKAAEVAGGNVTSNSDGNESSALQLIATRLTLAACLDPSGNIRRGSSAALQELIGRHPDIIVQGIPIVQVVDYQAVARRSRAMIEVAVAASELDKLYHDALLDALADWRGARAADPDSRRWAADAMRRLCRRTSTDRRTDLARQVLQTASKLKPRNLGTTAGSRHGLLLLATAIIESDDSQSNPGTWRRLLECFKLEDLSGSLSGKATNDTEMVIESVAPLFQALVRYQSPPDEMLSIIDHCILISSKPRTVDACATAMMSLSRTLDAQQQALLLRSWMDLSTQKRSDLVCKGRLHSLSKLFELADSGGADRQRILPFFADIVCGPDAIETRVVAMSCLGRSLRAMAERSTGRFDEAAVTRALLHGLNDYTNDQRGDIGSLLRLESLDVAEIITRFPMQEAEVLIAAVTPNVVRLAAERLNKVRHRASSCLKVCWFYLGWQPALPESYEHLADVSSESYFSHLLPLVRNEQVNVQLIKGLASSAAGTTEEIGRACCRALTTYALDVRLNAEIKQRMMSAMLSCVAESGSAEDSQVIPLLDFCTFMVEQGIFASDTDSFPARAWNTFQKVHTTTASIERLDALIRLYSAFLVYPDLRNKVLDKLTRLLLHRYPKIRNAAADVLYVNTSEEVLLERDWNGAAASNKPQVLELRRRLRVGVAVQEAA